jgi:serine/threonine-protein phosphatase 2B catalytic subunit
MKSFGLEINLKEIKFLHNEARGVSFNFGYSAVKEFLVKNNLLAVIRGHECQKQGFRYT